MNDNWRSLKIGDVCETFAGGTPNRSNSTYYQGNIPWISSGEVNRPFIQETDEHISEDGLRYSSAKWIPAGAILVAMYGATAGQVSKLLIKATSNQAVLALIPKEADDYFIYYSLKFKKEQILFLAQGSGQPNLSKALIDATQIDVPPLPQQRKIARILSTCDAVIEKTEAAIAKYRALKQGLMHDLFTRGIDLSTGRLRPKYEEAPELYKESELGWVPKEWEVRKLGNLTSKIGSGITPTGGSEVYKKAGVLFIRSQNVLNGRLSLENAAYISKKVDDRMVGSKVVPYDVLLNITGASIGRCAYFPKSLITANVNQHVCIIRFPKASKAQAVFTSQFLNSHFGQRQISRYNAGGNREGLNFQQLGSFDFPFASPKELGAISKKIEKVDNKIIHEESALSKYRQLKAGLMQDLLTGKVEVSVGEQLENN